MRASEATANPTLMGFEVYEHEKGLTVGQMYSKALHSLMDMVEKSGGPGWDEIVVPSDQYSTREFLELNGWSEGMIEVFGLLANQESVMNSSFLELFGEDSGNYHTVMVEIQGGPDRLPHAFPPEQKR